MKKKGGKSGCLGALFALVVIALGLYIPVWLDDAEARENRNRVNELISVGEQLDEAQQILRASGFKLSYDEPIKPTVNEGHFQQLVIVGERTPNFFESLGYSAGVSWMPFTGSESPYVIINASLDGRITKID